MKVISQLLEYFIERGALSPQQLQALAMQGLYELPDQEPKPDAVSTADPIDKLWTESTAPKPRRRGRGRPKVPVLQQVDLADWITQSIPKWTPQLEPLLRIARTTPLDKAAIAIRNAETTTLQDTLREALKHRAPALDTLWIAIGFDRYREILNGAKGPVAAAYRAILQCDENLKGSKYAWLLKEPAVRWVHNLALAQHRLLDAMGRFYNDEPEALARALGRDNDPVAYAAFVLLYNARRSSPDKIVTRIAAHASPVESLAIGCGGDRLFSSTGDNAISVWNARTGDLAHRVETEYRVAGLNASPDGRFLVVETLEGILERRELPPDGFPGPPLHIGGAVNRGARFGGNERIVARLPSGWIGVWDTATGGLRRFLSPELPKCASIVYSADGEAVIIVGWDGTTLMINCEHGFLRVVERFTIAAPKLAFDSEHMRAAVIYGATLSTSEIGGPISSQTSTQLPRGVDDALAYEPGSGCVVVAGDSEAVHVDPLSGETRPFEALTAPSFPLRFHFTSGKRLICLGTNGDITVWDLATFAAEVRWKVADNLVFTSAVHPNATLLAVSGRSGVTIWDYSTGHQVHALPSQTSDIHALSFHPHGGQLATGTISGRVKLWDVPSWVDRHFAWEPLGVTAMAYSPDGKSLTVGGGIRAGGAIRCWDLATGNPVWWSSGIDGPVHTIAASQDEAAHVFGASRDAIGAWSLSNGFLWRQHKSSSQIACCDEGRLLAAGGSNGDIELFDAATGASVGTLFGKASAIKILLAGPKATLLSVADDGEARLWDTVLRNWIGVATSGVRAAATSGHGMIALGMDDGTIRIWPAWRFEPGPGDAIPQRPLPEFEDWPRAWAQALIMDPQRVSRLLAYYTENMEACFAPSSYGQLRYEDLGLFCPDTWNFW